MTEIIGIGLSLIVIGILLSMSVRVVPEFGRLVLFRLGRCQGARGPGLVFMIPIVDRAVRVDLREVFFEVPPQTCITADNASVSIDFLVYDRVIDPERSVLAVTDFTGAARGLAITTLRAVVGAMDLDDVLSKREDINRVLHEKLDDVTDRWGIRIMAVEIREVVPPTAVADAMTLQMAAERGRRATVAEADGKREAAIAAAEGDKRSRVLAAEGEREASIQRAQGFALALKEIDAVAKAIDSKTLTLQYLEALKTLGTGDGTKLVLPMELVSLAQPLLAHALKAQAEPGAAG
ncbi:MAG: SPFH/Band 7/PHB domain protein [Myxococcales bacterium]|nr:SPFH/Band 7/PHB domain protein [Myxococcales bacterium]